MPTIKEITRICKRIMLSNLMTNDYTIALTPLLSGKHGIGKSQVAKAIAKDIGGICITIEGGTLKEGEITGIPYQYKNDKNEIEFRFLPYYAVDRIQKAEKLICNRVENIDSLDVILEGDENKYSYNDYSFDEKLDLIKNNKVKPVILFFDEINRTDNSVFRELMNVILTRTINGYKLPWWCFIIAAMNPSTQESMYATNELDPAQLDRFFKLKVKEDSFEWVSYAAENGYDKSIIEFIANHSEALSEQAKELDDNENPTPSPRGWSMINLILKARDLVDQFFTKEECMMASADIRAIVTSKVGPIASAMYYTSLKENSKLILADDIYDFRFDGIDLDVINILKAQSTSRNSLTSKSIVKWLKDNIDYYKKDSNYLNKIINKTSQYIKIIDNSSRLLFVKHLAVAVSKKDTNIFDYLVDIVDEELLELLEQSNINQNKIKGD